MRSFYRVMLGKQSTFAEACFAGGFIGADFGVKLDLSAHLHEDWRLFNQNLIPIYLSERPNKTRIAAGLACGALWTMAKGIAVGDIVLCPDGSGSNYVGEVTGDYRYEPKGPLPHRRPVHWLDARVRRDDMSEALRRSFGYLGTVSNLSPYAPELELLIGGKPAALSTASDDGAAVQDASVFALEKHLEYFLITNWAQTELSKEYEIYEGDDEAERGGQQYPTDTGPMDILCISKDKKTLLVVELKKGRASDSVVGQILRYMGYVREELAEDGQSVKGVVIGLEDDQKIRRALSMVPDITFYRYEINFRLVKTTS